MALLACVIFHLVKSKYRSLYLYALLEIITKHVRKGCECKSLNGLLQIDFNLCMMMSGPSPFISQKLDVQHYTLEA